MSMHMLIHMATHTSMHMPMHICTSTHMPVGARVTSTSCDHTGNSTASRSYLPHDSTTVCQHYFAERTSFGDNTTWLRWLPTLLCHHYFAPSRTHTCCDAASQLSLSWFAAPMPHAMATMQRGYATASLIRPSSTASSIHGFAQSEWVG